MACAAVYAETRTNSLGATPVAAYQNAHNAPLFAHLLRADGALVNANDAPRKQYFLCAVYGNLQTAHTVITVFTSPACHICHELQKSLLLPYQAWIRQHKGFALVVRQYPTNLLSLYVLALAWGEDVSHRPSITLHVSAHARLRALHRSYALWGFAPSVGEALGKAMHVLQRCGLSAPKAMASVPFAMLQSVLFRIWKTHCDDARVFGIKKVPHMVLETCMPWPLRTKWHVKCAKMWPEMIVWMKKWHTEEIDHTSCTWASLREKISSLSALDPTLQP